MLKKTLHFFQSWRFALAIIVASLLLIAVEGTWGWHLHSNLSFVLLLLMLIGLLGCNATKSISHIGLLLVIIGALVGAPYRQEAVLMANYIQENHYALKRDGSIVPLPFGAKLSDFRIDYYDDGVSPKQYNSILLIDGKPLTTSVNHPCSCRGWNIHQMDYDWRGGEYSVLKVVRDPWLPVVYCGMLLLAFGALSGLRQTWKSRRVIPLVLLLAVLFAVLSLLRINFSTLMPALRSLWFVPHLIIYMLAYSVLAIASVTSLMVACHNKRISPELPFKLLSTASSLLLLGMLCGAVWAKDAWGDYWTWDAKECWAAVTWLITLVGTHVKGRNQHKWRLFIIWLSFLAMQITWYGVNYLPASAHSLHTYNTSK